jgi:ubiquinone/menaquinone biosynthesis C-methylase UbiE
MSSPLGLKDQVSEFWSRASCGEELYLVGEEADRYRRQSMERYQLEPYIRDFIEPDRWAGKKTLEIGVGLGADHQLLAEAGAILSGVDLTERAVEHARERFKIFNLTSSLQQGDAENLPFPDASFDLVYSWGVIHHTPDTPKAASEIMRVLRPGGTFKVMIYNKWSLVGAMLWLRYALLAGKPSRSMADIYSNYLESPGTKAYTPAESTALFSDAIGLKQHVVLTHGDLLEGRAGQRHSGLAISVARAIWPRWLLRRFARNSGLFLLIEGQKPLNG